MFGQLVTETRRSLKWSVCVFSYICNFIGIIYGIINNFLRPADCMGYL